MSFRIDVWIATDIDRSLIVFDEVRRILLNNYYSTVDESGYPNFIQVSVSKKDAQLAYVEVVNFLKKKLPEDKYNAILLERKFVIMERTGTWRE